MATKPATLPEWATSGSAAVLEPLLAEKQLGWVPGSRGPAQWFNWWMELVFEWMVWLEAFESDPHTWSALQTFNAGVLSVWSSGGATAALHGSNTSVGVGGFPGVLGESTNGVGVVGFGKLGGISGGLTAPTAGASAVSGVAGTSDTFAGSFENTADGVGVKILTSGGTPGTALQLFPGSLGRALEASGSANVLVDLVTTASGVGTTSLRTLGGRIGVLGRPTAGVADGVGVRGEGQTTGSGVSGVGGASGGDGVTGTGGTNGVGGRFSGNGIGQGLVAVGGTGALGVGGEFGRGDADHTKPAITSVGAIALVASSDLAGNSPILNELHRKLVIRAWALVQLNNTAAPTILDRMNMASVSQATVGAGRVTFTMAQAMGSTSYGVLKEVDAGISNARVAQTAIGSTTAFDIEIFDPSAPTTVMSALNTNGYRVFVAVLGAQ